MVDLINRLRTGTHEQAVGLLRECFNALYPGAFVRMLHNVTTFDRLLAIGTPEACVGAAMMLIPTDGSMNMLEVSLAWEPSDAAVWPAGVVLWYPPRCGGDNWHVRTETASTAALALAAAIMETRNG